MADLQIWFAAQLRAIGWDELEGVYGYVSQLPDEEARSYLLGLLGDNNVELIDNYILKRNNSGNSSMPSSEMPSLGNQLYSRKKERRARGRAKKADPPRAQLRPGPGPGPSAPRSNPEDIRHKIREYRRLRKTVNCTNCAKIEHLIAEDGACSFCGKAIFSLWDGETGELQHLQKLSLETARNRHHTKPVNAMSNGSPTVVDLAGMPLLPEDMQHPAAQCTGPETKYPARCLQNSALPGGGPKFQSQYSDKLLAIFRTPPQHILPNSSILQFEYHD